MNKVRRKKLQKVIGKLEEALAELAEIQEEEEEARDNIPESLQDSEQYEQIDGYCYTLDDAASTLEDQIGELTEIVEGG